MMELKKDSKKKLGYFGWLGRREVVLVALMYLGTGTPSLTVKNQDAFLYC